MSAGLVCLTCRRYLAAGSIVSLHECQCIVPVPSEDGKTPLMQGKPVANPGGDAQHSPDARSPAEGDSERGKDRSRGRWIYPTLQVEINGQHYEVQASGAVYWRRMVRRSKKSFQRAMDRFIKDDGSNTISALVPGPLVRIPEGTPEGLAIAVAVRNRVRELYASKGGAP